MGPAQDRRHDGFTLGTSKEAQHNAVAQGGYPSGAGGQAKQIGDKRHQNVAHFSD